jgi:hypothetical protein
MTDTPENFKDETVHLVRATQLGSNSARIQIPDSIAHPIIYVRGYAMTEREQDEATVDPFCGFNLGSTVYRASPNKKDPAKKFIFESPIIRLAVDYGYSDVYEEGLDILDADWQGTIPRRSIVIHRYYDQASGLLGSGRAPSITAFAEGLSKLVLRVRDLVCADSDSNVSSQEFRCYLVAHSMGGLICRAFLQNPTLGDREARRCVDKVFTYATPHNGIDMAGLNVPRWLGIAEMNTFNVKNMAKYLNLATFYKRNKRVDGLPEKSFPASRFFCMIGTNRADYEAAMGLSRAFSGHGSDGLVKIDNASLSGVDSKGNPTVPCAMAYAYRSHSGFFGIVNSEEGYQNLTRFLFGDVRVDIWADVEAVRLPPEIANKPVNALYLFELLTSPRGKRWYLSRRIAEEDSVACRSHQRLVDAPDKNARTIYMSSVFLAKFARVKANRPSLAYDLTLGVRVPDYEIERKFWPDGHFEGAYLFRDTMIVELTPPQQKGEEWKAVFDWQSDNPGRASKPISMRKLTRGQVEMTVPFKSNGSPGIEGRLRFMVSPWNS